MSRHSLGQAKDSGVGSTILWVLLGGGAAVGLYYLLRPKAAVPMPARPGTRPAPLAPMEPPAAFANLNAVSARFGQVRENYRMGRLTPEQTVAQLEGLDAAVRSLVASGRADRTLAANLVSTLDAFKNEVRAFMAERQAIAMQQGQLGKGGVWFN